METYYFDCICHSAEHTLRFIFDPEDGELWTETHLCQERSFWKRLVVAVRYLFNRPSKAGCGHFSCTIFRQEDIPKLIDLLERANIRSSQLPLAKADGLKGLGMPIRNDQEKTGD